ncbi:glycosyltransferase family 2 protein [sulfur-oxidizing endosymbiont of Gigantopelta aegis]|uniref:glycosyltransferase family 2 protein n=1 Tax=sulfur-oxidizing endosymbiont of Gigantopelta aegis TaxID=2794934 RepID=UPI0018DB96AA|nr:glycosyltransferase [sulfur-oxidizing endosymbiont of Gigantopelta aegis]
MVSIIVSCYNHQNYITACVESIVRQTYDNIELIVIDDGSTDNSADILEQLSKKHQFSFERQENKGLTRTLNKALKKAQGKYIAPIGSDDILMLDKTEKQVAFLEQREDIAVVGGSIICIDDQGTIKQKQRINTYHEADFEMLFLKPKQIPPAPTVMIRTDILRKVKGFSTECNLEDLDLWLKITHAGHTIAVLNDIFAYYRQHSSNSYKNYQFMTESLMQTYSKYKNEPNYLDVKNQVLLRMFLKVSKKDRRYAWKILKQIAPQYYNLKFFRGLFHLCLPKPSIKR